MTEKGGYYTFEESSQGSAFIVWSEKAVPGALMFAQPSESKPLPAHKYKGSGKQQILSNMQSDRKRYWLGVCEFGKICKASGCGFMLISGAVHRLPTQVIIHYNDNRVEKMEEGKAYDLAAADAIATVHVDSSSFVVTQLALSLFTSKATSEGACITFTR